MGLGRYLESLWMSLRLEEALPEVAMLFLSFQCSIDLYRCHVECYKRERSKVGCLSVPVSEMKLTERYSEQIFQFKD